MKTIISKYKHAWILSYGLIYLPWFLLLEQKVVTKYTIVSIGLDQYIPFNELFVIPYFLWFGYIALTITYFFFYSKTDYYKCCAFLFLGMTICLVIYTLWPNGQNLRPTSFPRDNFLVDICKQLYTTDTSTNVCPSIHVFNSIGAHISIRNSACFKNKKWVVRISLLLAVSISLSTVFLKQHSAFDGLCSLLLSVVMYLIVYRIDYVKLIHSYKERKKIRTQSPYN